MKTNNMRLVETTMSPRDDLRAAIERHTGAIAELARISSAKVHARETSTAAGARLRDLEAKLTEARRAGDADLAAAALGEVDAAPRVTEADLARATADRDVARRTERALAEREEQQGNRVSFALRDVEQAVAAVIGAEATDTVAALLVKARAVEAELVALRSELKYLYGASAIGEPLVSDVRSYLGNVLGVLPSIDSVEAQDFSVHPAADRWRAAMAKLRSSADVPLPTS